MKNIERLVKHITKYGEKGILIHTIPNTQNWIIAQKIEKDLWMLTLAAPMGNITYNLGTVTTNQHLTLWEQLTRMEIENKLSQSETADQLKNKINKSQNIN